MQHFVIVCPSSLVGNWSREFDKWIGSACQPKRVAITKGGEQGAQAIKAYGNALKQQKTQAGQVLIISYDLFRMNAALLQGNNREGVSMLVVDEAHRLKNSSGSQTLSALQSFVADARLCITATPIQNNLSEFYNLVSFSCPGILGDLSNFRSLYERPISAGNSKTVSPGSRAIGEARSRELEEITSNILLRRLQKDVLRTFLPPRHEYLLFCSPSQVQCQAYKAATLSYHKGVDTDALAMLTSLRKLCTHPDLCSAKEDGDDGADDTFGVAAEGKEYEICKSGKMVVLSQLLKSIRSKSPSDKVVVVSNYTSALMVVKESILKPNGYEHLSLDGSTDVQNRQVVVDSFNRLSAEKCFVLLLSSKAGGCGLNLIGANRLIMVDPDWNPASDTQAMARVYREGQTKPCYIYRLFTAGTVEEVIYQRQHVKGNLVNLTMDQTRGKKAKSQFSKEELKDCFTLKEDCKCDTKQKLGSAFSEYNGSESLELQECDDDALLDSCHKLSAVLGHVHIVKSDVEHVFGEEAEEFKKDKGNKGGECDSDSGYDSAGTDECEFD
jgi:DNA repair and recombination protein RAD54 and RAD54-like protein